MRRPELQQFTVSPEDVPESLRGLQKFQDRVRLYFNDPRTHLTPVDPAVEPLHGELLFDGSRLFLCIEGEYYEIAIRKTVSDIPQWFLDQLKLVEETLTRAGVPKSEWKYYR